MKCGPSPSEMENFEKARRSIHAACDIPNGTEITKNMLITKRPGYGIRPKLIDIVIGRKSRIDIKEDRWITWEMI
jgi:N-acetylneuraminate synthase/N,N'-diacetyllegionaminate synthase